MIKIEIATSTMPPTPVPAQIIIIGASAVFGSAFENYQKTVPSNLESLSLAQSDGYRDQNPRGAPDRDAKNSLQEGEM